MSDTRFFTNEPNHTLLERFTQLVKGTDTFDCLVGYFYASGFASLAESLENTSKIRVLIGLSTDRTTYDLIQHSQNGDENEIRSYSYAKIKNEYSKTVRCEMDNSDDSYDVEKGVRLFIEWIQSGKLEIKVYRSAKIHAKVYIMKFPEDDRDEGRVITGSSNFSKSGLEGNLEFNVELKDSADYQYAQKKFDELWEDAVDVSEDYVSTIQKQTWLSNEITPYELYLKFLYEYLKEQINRDLDEREIFLPDGYMELQYQKDAVTDAISKLEQYNGVFISDVVGLGKTYITTMLLKTLNARAIILAPPVLVDKNNPGSWPRVLEDFGVGGCRCESIGKLDKVVKWDELGRYKYVVIDEAHKFRSESTQMYEELHEICAGKKVILVTATPLNNDPRDILAQIKLFQPAHASTLPNPETRDLDTYFSKLQARLNGLDRQKNEAAYLQIIRENSEKIRKDILQYLMVRRTRSSIVKYYKKDLEKQNLHFPEVADPEALYYEFDEETDKLFTNSIERIVKDFKYARYTPLLYLKVKDSQMETGQRNMQKFMRILLLKRLESSFHAFKMSVKRMMHSYEKFIHMYHEGIVYTGDHSVKNLMKLVEEDNFSKIDELIIEGKVQEHTADEFEPEFLADLEHDLEVLRSLHEDWENIKNDPKLDVFTERMRNDPILKGKKVLIFTESKETADYLKENLSRAFGNCVFSMDGTAKERERQIVISNFDGKVSEENREDKYRILIATDVLSEGVNLHRSNVVVNYDIPWNPVRMIQRVGRINRVDTKFDRIYIYNFFPTGPINEEIGLEQLAVAKIGAFIEMLGNDAKLLTDEEVKSHDLFNRLTSRSTITGEDDADEDPELKYLALIRDIRDNNKEYFERIINLPRKARVARKAADGKTEGLITFFRRGRLRKIYLCNETTHVELDFVNAAEYLKASPEEKQLRLPEEMFEYLDRNKAAFDEIFRSNDEERTRRGKAESQLNSFINAVLDHPDGLTSEEIENIEAVKLALEKGIISKPRMEKILSGVRTKAKDARGIYNILREKISESTLFEAKSAAAEKEPVKEVILSEYLEV